jgi:hypothetical protein
MQMQNPEKAVVDIEKIRDYCLSPDHPRGRHKARVFQSTLGLSAQDSALLRQSLLEAAYGDNAEATEKDEYGQRYVVDFTMRTDTGTAIIRSSWIVRRGEDFPRLTSCYVK